MLQRISTSSKSSLPQFGSQGEDDRDVNGKHTLSENGSSESSQRCYSKKGGVNKSSTHMTEIGGPPMFSWAPSMASKVREEDLKETGILSEIFRSVWFDNLCGVIVGANLALIVWETDARAQLNSIAVWQQRNGVDDRSLQQEGDLEWQINAIGTINLVFLAYYSVECVCRLLATEPWHRFFFSRWNVLDVFVVLVDVCGLFFQWVMGSAGGDLTNVALLRNLRMCRLLRLSRFFTAFRELYSLVCGLTNCMKTLLWSAGLILLTLTVWSIVAVEYVSPLMPPIDDSGLWEGCGWCPQAFETVMGANLTFFQIISGDGWSVLARPLIRRHFWVAALFVSMIFVVSFGLLNLIIAAIVDTAALARENDIDTLARIRHVERQEAWNTFEQLCVELDEDRSTGISLAELRSGLATNPMLQAYFSVMGVEEDDLEEVFSILDEDDNGVLSYAEFHSQLYKMKTMEVKTQLFYVTRYVQVIQRQIAKQEEMLSSILSSACASEVSSPEGVLGGRSCSQESAHEDLQNSVWRHQHSLPTFTLVPRNIVEAAETVAEVATQAKRCLVASSTLGSLPEEPWIKGITERTDVPEPEKLECIEGGQVFVTPRVHSGACPRHPEDSADNFAGRPPLLSPRSEWSSSACSDILRKAEDAVWASPGSDDAVFDDNHRSRCDKGYEAPADTVCDAEHTSAVRELHTGLLKGWGSFHERGEFPSHEGDAERRPSDGGKDEDDPQVPRRKNLRTCSQNGHGTHGHATCTNTSFATAGLESQRSHSDGAMDVKAGDEDVLAEVASH